jgi:hypothetical protein
MFTLDAIGLKTGNMLIALHRLSRTSDRAPAEKPLLLRQNTGGALSIMREARSPPQGKHGFRQARSAEPRGIRTLEAFSRADRCRNDAWHIELKKRPA